MHTPSLGRRVVVAGMAVVTTLALWLDVLLYVSLRSSLQSDLRAHVAAQGLIIKREAARVPLVELPGRLADLGLHAEVRDGAGTRLRGSDIDGGGGPVVTGEFDLDGGASVLVSVERGAADRTLRRLIWLEAIATPLVVALALMLLRLIAEVAMRPLDRIAAAARRTAGGHRGERLHPHPTDTRLGQMATAYDEMLDALEAAVAEAQEAHAESERLLARNRRILATAREAFVSQDENGVIREWNAEAERIFGWPAAEAIGRPVAGTVLAPVDPGDERGLESFVGVEADGPADRVVDFTALHRDGRYFPARMTAWTTHHGPAHTVSAFLWDVTERLAVEEAIARLTAVVEVADDAIISVALDGTVLTWNPAAERMFGYPAGEAVGRSVEVIVPEDARSEARAHLGALGQEGSVRRFETMRRSRHHGLIPVAITMSAVRDLSGDVYAAACTLRDITDERRFAGQLDASRLALEVALQRAQASEVETRRFLDDAAHQLRAPLTSLRACAEGLLRTNDPAMRDELVAALGRESARAGRLVAGLLRLARLDHGAPIVAVPCDAAAVCAEEAARVQALPPFLEVTVTVLDSAPRQAQIDPGALTEIVSNLLDNARRHARTGAEVELAGGPGWMTVTVGDDGPGLPDGMARAAFDRFVSLDGGGGSGLGLPIARELARAHGGDLGYEDGAFVLRLPLVDGDDEKVEPQAPYAEAAH